MSDIEQFYLLIVKMQSTDNEERKTAEELYEKVETPQRASLLFQLFLNTTIPQDSRSMAMVLLRRIVSNDFDTLWGAWDANTQKQFLDQLLQSATHTQEAVLKKRVADVIAEVARSTIDEETGNQKWPDVIKFVEHCGTANDAAMMEMAMTLIENVPNIFGGNVDAYVPGVKHLIEASLQSSSASVRSSAVKAYVAFVSDNEESDKVIKAFQPLLANVLRVCEHVVQEEDDDDGPLQCLGDLAQTVPKILTPQLNALFNFCLQLMTELNEDLEEWLTCDNPDEEDEDEESPAVAESALDRVSCSVHGKALLNPFLQIVDPMLKDGDWKKRHAGLMGLSTIGEGCARQMEGIIDTVISTIVPYVQDPHPRVRYAACNAIGQMSTDFAPTLQKKCHEKVVAALLHAVDDTTCSRVSAHGAAALVNFCEDCPKQIMQSYLPLIMNKLEHVLETTFRHLTVSGKKIVLEQVITTIASVADASQDLFVAYYDRLITPLKYILQNAEGDNFKVLRGKTIECISLIGLAVGIDKFGKDAEEVMAMLSGQVPSMSSDDPQSSYMIASWARICKVMGPRFAPYLPTLMPAVMAAAAYSPDVAVVDDEEVPDDAAWTFHSLGDNKNFGVRTSGLEEKASACDMLVCYARELKEAFAPYVDEVAALSVGHLKFLFHEGVRMSAAEILPRLLACVHLQGPEAQRRLWDGFLPALLSALENEVEVEVTAELINAIGESMEEMHSGVIKAEEMQQIVAAMATQLDEYEKRRVEREQLAHDEDELDEEAKQEMDDEAEAESSILARLSDLLHSAFTKMGAGVFAFFEPLMPKILALVDEQRAYMDRQWGICLLDDFIEFASHDVFKYHPHFINHMIKALGSEFPEVRQAAAYGFGAAAASGVREWLPVAAQALNALAASVALPDARETEEGTIATENAIAAVAKILKYNDGSVDANQVVPLFLSWLPTSEDIEESPHIYGLLADLVEGSHPAVVGTDGSGLARVLAIIVGAFQLRAFDDDDKSNAVKARLTNILRSISVRALASSFYFQSLPSFQQIIAAAALDGDQQQQLQQLLQA